MFLFLGDESIGVCISVVLFAPCTYTSSGTPKKLCWISPWMARACCSPKEGSLRQRTWQRALPRHRCPSTERWELRREKRKDREWHGEWKREERQRERERGDGGTARGGEGVMTARGAVSPFSVLPPKTTKQAHLWRLLLPLSRLQTWTCCCCCSFGQVTPESSEHACHQIL